jgi:hypothetical protein
MFSDREMGKSLTLPQLRSLLRRSWKWDQDVVSTMSYPRWALHSRDMNSQQSSFTEYVLPLNNSLFLNL